MNIISWNVNGLQSCIKRQVFNPIEDILPDVFCCQEIKTKQEPIVIEGYNHYFYPAEQDRYSGTMTMTIDEPLDVIRGIGVPELDTEGRVITVDMGKIYVVNTYVPNSQKNLERRKYRREWDEAYAEFLKKLRERKPVVACGDFNVAMLEIDFFEENLRQHYANLGYASDEQAGMEKIFQLGFSDAFRHLYPEERSYTWWSNRMYKRNENRGWRLDYFLISNNCLDVIKDVIHHAEISGSDHCPIELEVSI